MAEVAVLTTRQVAHHAGVSTSTVRKWVATGALEAAFTTPGGHHRFRQVDVEAALGMNPGDAA